MDALTTSAASGMRARLEALDMLANNLANAGTAGYKADREFYDLYRSAESSQSPDAPADPVIRRNWMDLSSGALTQTGNASDLALSGRGFFVVAGPSGPLYTRNGSFRISAAGNLETQDGYAVRATGGGIIRLNPAESFEVDGSGAVRQRGQLIGRIEVTDVPGADTLEKQGHTYFRLTDPAATTTQASAEVRQGSLESANVSPVETSVRLVSLLRQFEMLQKATQMAGEMNRRAVEEVARVS